MFVDSVNDQGNIFTTLEIVRNRLLAMTQSPIYMKFLKMSNQYQNTSLKC